MALENFGRPPFARGMIKSKKGGAMESHTNAEINRTKEMARLLLSNGAVSFSVQKPFTYASGRLGPIYCDNRQLLAHPPIVRQIGEWLAHLVRVHFSTAQALIGVATAGIPHATVTGLELNLPMGYVRAQAKAHGKKNQVEGWSERHSKVVVVEDLINSGLSSIAAIGTLREAQLQVIGMICLVDYELTSAHQHLIKEGVSLKALTTFSALLEMAQVIGQLKAEDRTTLLKWHESPESWTPSL